MIRGDEIRDALARADKLIDEMSSYVGQMAVPAQFFAAGDLPPQSSYNPKRHNVDVKTRLTEARNR